MTLGRCPFSMFCSCDTLPSSQPTPSLTFTFFDPGTKNSAVLSGRLRTDDPPGIEGEEFRISVLDLRVQDEGCRVEG